MNEQQTTQQTIEPTQPTWGPYLRDALHPALAPTAIIIVTAAAYAFKLSRRAKSRRRQPPRKMFPKKGKT